MGLLILSLGGFGITNLGGSINKVGTVDGKPITVTSYAREVQSELARFQEQTGQPITFAQARLFGLDQQVLNRLINQRALEAEAERLGLSIGDENLRDVILRFPAFQGLSGTFDRTAYRFALENAGLNEAEFEQTLREAEASNLLQTAVSGGVAMPQAFSDALLAYLGETRDFTMVVLSEANLETPVETADDATLRSYYEANTEAFMLPATRDITYAWLSPDMILDTVEVDEEALRTLFEERAEEYNIAERRLLERLVMPTAEEAQEAVDQIAAGTAQFEDFVEARGFTLADVDLGDLSAVELGTGSDAVFAAASGQTIGPVTTDLGPAIFRINGILNAQITTFEDARPELREELARDRARRVIDAQINDIDDLLAGGATLEELSGETDMQVGTINWHPGMSEGIAGYEGFRAQAAAVSSGDFPQVETLEDGGIFAIRLDGETEATPAGFDAAKEDVIAAWRAEAVTQALTAQAEAYAARLKAGEDIISLGQVVAQESGIARSDFIPDVPATLVEEVFTLAVGDIATVAGLAQVAVVELDSITDADLTDGEAASLRGILNQGLNQALSQELLQAYTAQIRLKADVEVDQAALNAVAAQLQ